MNVSEVYIIVVLMPIATTLKGLTNVRVNLDSDSGNGRECKGNRLG